MRAMVCVEQGSPARWAWREHPLRALGPNDIHVRIHAAGLNFPDRLASEGNYQIPTPPPYVPCLEAAGDIIRTGGNVTELRPGDRIVIDGSAALQGLAAEECVVDHSCIFTLPPELSHAEGAAFPVVYATGYHGLVQRGRLQRGETLVVHGAAGGVGLAAMQIGKALGARTIGTVAGASKAAALHGLGFEEIVRTDIGDVRLRVLELTGGRGADAIYDPVGGEIFDASMRCIAKEGRILIIGGASGVYGTLKTNHALIKEISVIGVLYGAWKARKPEAARDNMQRLLAMAASGAIRPHIWKTMPMSEIAAALDHLGDREVVGKIVLVPSAHV